MTATGGNRTNPNATSRRDYLKVMTVGAAAAGLGYPGTLLGAQAQREMVPPPGHDRRMKWWRDAKYGMFIHWGLYSVLGREAWAMGFAGLPNEAPDDPVTIIAAECDSEPIQHALSSISDPSS